MAFFSGNATKQSSPSSWKARLFLLILILFVILITTSLISSWRANREVNQEITELEQTISSLEQDNLEFSSLIEYFNSTAYIEERARTDLGLKKEGEQVVVVTNTTQAELKSSTTQTTQETTSNPKRWWNYFFN